MNKKVFFITGSSTGFGWHLAEESLKQGHKVIATARTISKLNSLVEQYRENILPLTLDVTNIAQIRQSVKLGLETFGRIDVLINNAGYGLIGAVEEVSRDEIEKQFSTNVFAPVEIIQEILPTMRANKSGHIINISSIVGFTAYSGTSMYAASKHAIEGISQALAQEVEEFGIHVSVINPGPFRTNFAGSSLNLAKEKIDAYAQSVHLKQDIMKNKVDGSQVGDPKAAALAILSLTQMDNPPFTLPLGKFAYDESKRIFISKLDEIEKFKKIGLPTDFED